MAGFLAKFLLLCLFFIIIFLLTRLLEFLSSHDLSFIHQRPPQPLDSTLRLKTRSATVTEMKSVLDQRGVSYQLVVEKKELLDLVKSTGEVGDQELILAITAQRAAVEQEVTTQFNNSNHFNELVEDTKDSVWLLQLVDKDTGDGDDVRRLSASVWGSTVRRYTRFGVRAGRVQCSVLSRVCRNGSVRYPGLVLALPEGQDRSKDTIDYHAFPPGRPRYSSTDRIWKWIDSLLAKRVPSLNSASQLVAKHPAEGLSGWLDSSKPPRPLDLVAFVEGPTRPLVLSALSVKFTGRVHFWSLDLLSKAGQSVLAGVQARRPSLGAKCTKPVYVLFTPENEYIFGHCPGEYLSFASLDLFLRSVQPESNDIFLGCLTLLNLMALLQLATKQGSLLTRLLSMLWSLLWYNMVYLLLCLPVIGLFSLRSVYFLINTLISSIRHVSLSRTACLIRGDILRGRYSVWVLSVEFGVYLMVVWFLERWRTGGVDRNEEEEEVDSGWTSATNTHLEDLESGEGSELLRSFLFLDLRLPTPQPPAYLAHLPVWTCALPNPVGSTTEEDDEDNLAGGAIHWPAGVMFSHRCVICLDRFGSGACLCALPCGHAFHESCVKSWLVSGGHNACPTCRWPANKAKSL